MRLYLCACVCVALQGGYSQWITHSISSPCPCRCACVCVCAWSRLGCSVNRLISGSRVTHGLGHTQTHTHTHSYTSDLHTNAFRLGTRRAPFIKDSCILTQQSGLLQHISRKKKELVKNGSWCQNHLFISFRCFVILQMEPAFSLMINKATYSPGDVSERNACSQCAHTQYGEWKEI